MAPNTVEDTPIDVGRGKGFNRTRTKGVAHGQFDKHKVDRNRVEGFVHNQPINQNISGGYSYYQLDGEDESEYELPEDYYGYQLKKRHSRSGGFYRTDDFSTFQFDALVAALPSSEGGEEAQLKRIAELQAENDAVGQELQRQLEAADEELKQVQELFSQAADNCLNLKKPE